MKKIDLSSDALNFFEEEPSDNGKRLSNPEESLSLDEDLIQLDETFASLDSEPDDLLPPLTEEEIQQIEEKPAQKKLKFNFDTGQKEIEESLDELIQEELLEEKNSVLSTGKIPDADKKTEPKGSISAAEESGSREAKQPAFNFYADEPEEPTSERVENPFFKKQEDSGTSESEESEFYEYEYTDEGSSSKKWLWIILLMVIIGGGAGYYFFFYKPSAGTITKTATVQAPAEEGKSALQPANLQELLRVWSSSLGRTNMLLKIYANLNQKSNSNAYISSVKMEKDEVTVTVVAADRDEMARFNSYMRTDNNIARFQYINSSEVNIDNFIRLVSDITIIPAAVTVPAGLNTQDYLSVKTDRFISEAKAQLGNRIQVQTSNVSSASPNLTVSRISLKGQVSYRAVNGFLQSIPGKFPMVQIEYLRISSKRFGPLDKDPLDMIMTVVFTEAAI